MSPMEDSLPSDVQDYLEALASRLDGLLKDRLVGVYLFGSAAYGAYEAGQSDLDVQAVVKDPLTPADKQAIAALLLHSALPCPAAKLEFVAYAQAAVNPISRHPRFELNLNTGAGQPDHVGLDPGKEASHWFLLDLAMGRQLGRRLLGAEKEAAFGVIPRRWILEAIADSLEWHRANESGSSNSVLNACRGWRYIVDGQFSSKAEGAKWALQQPDCPDVVQHALVARENKLTLDAAGVTRLYETVIHANRLELDTTSV